MRNLHLPAICTLLLSGTLLATAGPKTTSPVKIDPDTITKAPYRYNGVVLTGISRGSGFCAWNQRTFFSAAHVVYEDTGWGTPPSWVPAVNEDNVTPDQGILSRGYYRLNRYADIVNERGKSAAFGSDVILGFAFEDLIPGKPAKINFNGGTDLREKGRKLITGYPAMNFYTSDPTDGYHMYETGPFRKPFKSASDGSLETTLIATGPGNSGGPIWTLGKNEKWKASGILVGGLPSETVVYPFSKNLNSLTRAVTPLLKKKIKDPVQVTGVSASSVFFPYNRSQKLPDGTEDWSSFKVGVHGFGDYSSLTNLKISLTIKTSHRGDLQVYLVAPGGYSAMLHNEEGAGNKDLKIRDQDITQAFAGIPVSGTWTLRVRDRLKGDVATLKSFHLQIDADRFDDEGNEL